MLVLRPGLGSSFYKFLVAFSLLAFFLTVDTVAIAIVITAAAKTVNTATAAVATAVDTAVVSEGTVFSKTWTVGRVLGEGACGKVYAASCVHKDKSSINVAYDIVVKVIPLGPGGKGKAAITQQRIAT